MRFTTERLEIRPISFADKERVIDLVTNETAGKPYMFPKFECREAAEALFRRLVTLSGQEVRLTQTEYNIVTVLAHHAGQVMTYAAIIRAVWGTTDDGSVKKLQVNLANIRKKLGERPGERRYISNELGVGYRMISDDE